MRLGVDGAFVDGQLVAGDVAVEDAAIVGIGLPVAGTGLLAAPGFVDLQVNGFAGVDLLTTDAEGVRAAADALLATGVTAWQPTLITSLEADVVRACEVIDGVADELDGARVLGLHLEGPFLAPARLGTHPAVHRRDPDLALLRRLLDAGPVSTVTLAPELPGAAALIDHLHASGVAVAAGHSDATAAQANAAFDAGVRSVTHVFNAMRRFTPREPGVAGAALARPEVIVEAIVDGHHLAPETVRVVWAATAGRFALATDAVAAAGLGDGCYRLGSVEVTVTDGVVRRNDGTLAGSVLTMPEAVRNLVALGVPAPAAIEAVTGVPARVLGRDDIGRLTVGGPADVVVLDGDLEVVSVMRAGRVLETAP